MTHTHTPGDECHSHSHSHSPSPTAVMQEPPNLAMQAMIDQDFKPVALDVNGDVQVVCGAHKLEKCTECGLDFVNLNRLTKQLACYTTFKCPPPANVVSQNLSKAITATKEEGNAFFKAHRPSEAISRYNMAASIAVQRPPWESNQVMREELSTVISNRSAAFLEEGDYVSAIADADTVIQLRRNWSKGHFRKAKALLGLGEWEAAKDAIRLGLQFEPNNAEMNEFLVDIDKSAAAAARASEL